MPFTLTGAQVRQLRTALGVSQAELARSLGYTRAAICRWERSGAQSIPRTQYRAVLDYLKARRQDGDDLAALAASL